MLIALSLYLPSTLISVTLLTLMIAVFGLPHGLLDPWLFDANISHKPKRMRMFCACDIGVFSLGLCLWWYSAGVALLLFFALSALHFGADIYTDKMPYQYLKAGVYGSSVIAWPFVWHNGESVDILSVLGVSAAASACQLLAVIAVFAAALLLLRWPPAKAQAFEWPLLAGLAYFSSPFAYFAIYFCCIHSWRHFYQHRAIWLSHGRQNRKAILLLWLLSLVFLGLLIGVLAHAEPISISASMIAAVFYLLAALTLPHMALVFFHALKNRQ